MGYVRLSWVYFISEGKKNKGRDREKEEEGEEKREKTCLLAFKALLSQDKRVLDGCDSEEFGYLQENA